MLLLLTQLIGRLFAFCPEFILQALSWSLGNLLYFGYGARRHMMLRNLSFAFPEKPEAWRRFLARRSCIRMIETGVMSIASPYFSKARILRMGSMDPRMKDYFRELEAKPRPVLFGTAHFAYWEALTWVPVYAEGIKLPELLTVFRPLRNPQLDAWLRSTRERFGVKLMSRRGGLHAALHVMQRNGCVAILFDQSAGSHGFLTPFFGRDCSTTPLPGLLLEKTGGDLTIVMPRRTGFWRFSIQLIRVEAELKPESVTLALNRALEKAMREDEELCASWLWLHHRWRILDRPDELELLHKRRGGPIA